MRVKTKMILGYCIIMVSLFISPLSILANDNETENEQVLELAEIQDLKEVDEKVATEQNDPDIMDNVPIQRALNDTIADQFPDPNMAQSVAYAVSGGNINAPITQTMIDATTVLNLWSSNIESIEGIEIFTELKTLDISTNNLTTLPDSMAQMTKLRGLEFNKNKFTVFPEVLCSLPNLTFISFWNNQIAVVPESISNITSLKSLNFAFNKITTLPDSIGDLSNLTTLSLWSTQIHKLPESITKLSNLSGFYLYNAQLYDLSQSQYDFLSATGSYIYSQWYTEELKAKGASNTDYTFSALPAYEQYPNYGVVFTFTLKAPDGSTTTITPTIANGSISIDGSLLTQEGDYVLTSIGAGGVLSPVRYTHNFSIGEESLDYTNAEADGVVDKQTSTKITVTLSKAPDCGDLDLDCVELFSITRAFTTINKESITPLGNGVYELAISGLWDEGTLIDVTLAKSNVAFSQNTHRVALHKEKAGTNVVPPKEDINKPSISPLVTKSAPNTKDTSSTGVYMLVLLSSLLIITTILKEKHRHSNI